MTAPVRTLAVAVVLVAVATGIVVGTVFPTLGVPDVYAVAVSSAGAAVILTLISVFVVDSFDDDRYRATGPRRQLLDAAVVAVGGFVAAGIVVFAGDQIGMGPLIATLGDRVYISGRRMLAAGIGVGAGIGLFYVRNQQFLVNREVT